MILLFRWRKFPFEHLKDRLFAWGFLFPQLTEKKQQRKLCHNSLFIFSIFIFMLVFSLFCWDCKKVKTKKVDHAIEMISFYFISFFKLKLWEKFGTQEEGWMRRNEADYSSFKNNSGTSKETIIIWIDFSFCFFVSLVVFLTWKKDFSWKKH